MNLIDDVLPLALATPIPHLAALVEKLKNAE
jgi:hypothetical protein